MFLQCQCREEVKNKLMMRIHTIIHALVSRPHGDLFTHGFDCCVFPNRGGWVWRLRRDHVDLLGLDDMTD